ncbi:MAG TPA: GntR family transcriptional regulator [Dongiaceae bacterium]|jgi:DNA-binding GntR family transcriptional regulator|nr:GntR family transcriptional regulator [Dongiaceae bacterium]
MTNSEDRILQEQEHEAPKVVGMGRRRALSPIPRETLHDRVYAELRRSLIHGAFATGDTLRIQELAEKLQTSTMPVREALARLVSEQALEALPNRSVRVPVITRERLEDLARARTLIEGQIVALALPNLTATDFAHLRQLAGQCEAAFRSQDSDRARITSELNHAFHYYIYRAARSAVLIPIIESLWLQSGPYVQAAAILHEEQHDLPGAHHHWALIEAMERGDEAGAIKALTDDISRSFNLVRQRLDAEDAEKKAANDG